MIHSLGLRLEIPVLERVPIDERRAHIRQTRMRNRGELANAGLRDTANPLDALSNRPKFLPRIKD
jgi:hypothetical protein